MTIPITGQPPVPGLDDPATFNTKALNLFAWITGSMLDQFNNVDPADYFDIAAITNRANLIINGSGRINQRAYVSGAATSGANQYTLDRWRVVTSGQNLSFTGTAAARVMTAPAGGVEQVVEGVNVVGGTYIISWTGTATCTVDGVAKAAGATFTLTANTNATVRFSGGTFTDVQIEAGTTPTAFDRRRIDEELRACQRYYETKGIFDNLPVVPALSSSTGRGYFTFHAPKRVTPSMAFVYSGGGTGAAWSVGLSGGFQTSSHSTTSGFSFSADAEI